MKKIVLALAIFTSSYSMAQSNRWDQYNWFELIGPNQGDWTNRANARTFSSALPLGLGIDAFGRYVYTAAHITHFVVRVGPGSLDRGCEVQTKQDDFRSFTGVMTTWTNITPTRLEDTSDSQARRGWKNYYFSVNGGRGAPATHVNVAFRYLRSSPDCFYNVLFTSDATQFRGQPARSIIKP